MAADAWTVTLTRSAGPGSEKGVSDPVRPSGRRREPQAAVVAFRGDRNWNFGLGNKK